MNPKLPFNGYIYTLTVGKVLTTMFQINLAFVQSHSQSQAMLTIIRVSLIAGLEYGMERNGECTQL